MDDFEGLVVLVAGSSGGVGRAVAAQLAARGATLALHFNSRDTHAKELIAEYGEARVQAFQADLSDRVAARDLVSTVVQHFGRIDGFISTALRDALEVAGHPISR